MRNARQLIYRLDSDGFKGGFPGMPSASRRSEFECVAGGASGLAIAGGPRGSGPCVNRSGDAGCDPPAAGAGSGASAGCAAARAYRPGRAPRLLYAYGLARAAETGRSRLGTHLSGAMGIAGTRRAAAEDERWPGGGCLARIGRFDLSAPAGRAAFARADLVVCGVRVVVRGAGATVAPIDGAVDGAIAMPVEQRSRRGVQLRTGRRRPGHAQRSGSSTFASSWRFMTSTLEF